MNIAITGASCALGLRLAERLGTDHDVRVSDVEDDVLDADAVARLLEGVDRVVHLARARRRDDEDPATADGRILDTALIGTYHVMMAAREAGAQQVVQVTDVCIYDGYDDDIILSEDFVALPDTTAEQLAEHLVEGVGHEFAREQPGLVLTLRLGRLVDAETLAPDAVFHRDWLDISDAMEAITRGLQMDRYDSHPDWGLYNLVAETPYSRFTMRKISSGTFGFTPAVDFHAWWPDPQEAKR